MTAKLTFPLLVASLTVGVATPSLARTWTSADGSKSFEGEFVSHEDGSVTVRKEDGSEISFKLDVLSGADQKWVEKQVALAAEATALATAEIPSAIEGKLVKLSGKRFKRYEPQAPAKYYLLYFSASW